MKQEAIQALKKGQLVVMPTDTIFGILAMAENPEAMEKLLQARQSPEQKKSIILISELADLEKFGIKLTAAQQKVLNQVWPGPVSVILDLPQKNEALAFRLPALPSLRNFIRETGPLAAPSANLSNRPPAQNAAEARKYFGDQVAVYVDGSVNDPRPSTLIYLDPNGQIEIRRQGVAEIKLNEVE